MPHTPELRDGYFQWRRRQGAAELRFVGRGRGDGLEDALEAAGGGLARRSWAEQIHSARVLEARDGASGRGDALVTRQPGLALCVATADCVPLVLIADDALAVAHAGWRGIVAGVAAAAVRALSPSGPGEPSAWLGPSIGPCCYEVGADVARRVTDASGPEALAPGRGERPHLDLHRGLAIQLAAAGVRDVQRVERCTRCHPDELWSYRRAGERAGRNYAFGWLREVGP